MLRSYFVRPQLPVVPSYASKTELWGRRFIHRKYIRGMNQNRIFPNLLESEFTCYGVYWQSNVVPLVILITATRFAVRQVQDDTINERISPNQMTSNKWICRSHSPQINNREESKGIILTSGLRQSLNKSPKKNQDESIPNKIILTSADFAVMIFQSSEALQWAIRKNL